MQAMEDGAPPGQVLLRCGLYASAAAGLITLTLCRNMVLPYASVRAARLMHGGMVRAVLRAKVSWFEATPLGRVLNRFSSDISQIDQVVAGQFKDTVVMAFNVTGIALVRGTLLTTH